MKTLAEAQLKVILEQVEQVIPDWRDKLPDPEWHTTEALWIKINPLTGHIKASWGWNGDRNAIPRSPQVEQICALRGIEYPYPSNFPPQDITVHPELTHHET